VGGGWWVGGGGGGGLWGGGGGFCGGGGGFVWGCGFVGWVLKGGRSSTFQMSRDEPPIVGKQKMKQRQKKIPTKHKNRNGFSNQKRAGTPDLAAPLGPRIVGKGQGPTVSKRRKNIGERQVQKQKQTVFRKERGETGNSTTPP